MSAVSFYIKFVFELMTRKTVVSESMIFPLDFNWIAGAFEELQDEFSSDPNSFYKLDQVKAEEILAEMEQTGALILRKWQNNQTTIVVGCGHSYCQNRHGPNEYLIDVNINMLPDMFLEVCHQSLANALPKEAHNQIQKIYFEGLCGEETSVFYEDCLALLAEGGGVWNGHAFTLIKQGGELYAVAKDGSLTKYEPWTHEDIAEDITESTFGCDIFDWKANMKRNGYRIKEILKMEPVTALEVARYIASFLQENMVEQVTE